MSDDIRQLLPLPKSTRSWVLQRLAWDSTNCQTAQVELQRTYTLRINPEWWSGLTVEQRRSVLLHEIAHVWRGDCPRGLELAQKGQINPQTWNIATDAVINRTLNDLPPGVRYEGACERAGLKPSVTWYTAYHIAQALTQSESSDGSGESQQAAPGADSGDQDGRTFEGDVVPSGDPVDHAREKADLEKAARADGLDPAKDFPASRRPQPRQAGRGEGAAVWTPDKRAALRVAVDLRAEVAKSTKRREPVRSWRREGRLPLLRGISRVPRPSVGLYLDVSGSTSEHWSDIAAIARGLRRDGVEVFVFNDGVREWDCVSPLRAGGGTTWQPIREHATGRFDKAIVATDGYFFDSVDAIGGVEVVWLVMPGGRKPADFGRTLAWPEEGSR